MHSSSSQIGERKVDQEAGNIKREPNATAEEPEEERSKIRADNLETIKKPIEKKLDSFSWEKKSSARQQI